MFILHFKAKQKRGKILFSAIIKEHTVLNAQVTSIWDKGEEIDRNGQTYTVLLES